MKIPAFFIFFKMFEDCIAMLGNLHNGACANQYKRECNCDDSSEWDWQVCRELNQKECKLISSNTSLCRNGPHFGTYTFDFTKEPCRYCAEKLWRLNNWYDECSSRGGWLQLDCNSNTEDLYQKQYGDCNKAEKSICWTWDYSHCILDDSQLEENEKNCEAICVDEWGNSVNDRLCDVYTRPLCTWLSPGLEPSYNDCNHCAKNWFPYCFPINFDLNCDESKY